MGKLLCSVEIDKGDPVDLKNHVLILHGPTRDGPDSQRIGIISGSPEVIEMCRSWLKGVLDGLDEIVQYVERTDG